MQPEKQREMRSGPSRLGLLGAEGQRREAGVGRRLVLVVAAALVRRGGRGGRRRAAGVLGREVVEVGVAAAHEGQRLLQLLAQRVDDDLEQDEERALVGAAHGQDLVVRDDEAGGLGRVQRDAVLGAAEGAAGADLRAALGAARRGRDHFVQLLRQLGRAGARGRHGVAGGHHGRALVAVGELPRHLARHHHAALRVLLGRGALGREVGVRHGLSGHDGHGTGQRSCGAVRLGRDDQRAGARGRGLRDDGVGAAGPPGP